MLQRPTLLFYPKYTNDFRIKDKALTYALLEEAERLNVDIAPDHKPGYITLAYAIVNEVGGKRDAKFS